MLKTSFNTDLMPPVSLSPPLRAVLPAWNQPTRASLGRSYSPRCSHPLDPSKSVPAPRLPCPSTDSDDRAIPPESRDASLRSRPVNVNGDTDCEYISGGYRGAYCRLPRGRQKSVVKAQTTNRIIRQTHAQEQRIVPTTPTRHNEFPCSVFLPPPNRDPHFHVAPPPPRSRRLRQKLDSHRRFYPPPT